LFVAQSACRAQAQRTPRRKNVHRARVVAIFFEIFFARETSHAASSSRRVRASEIAFLKISTLRATSRAVVRGATRESLRRERISRDTAVFVRNTRKFACTFPGNAYHDRMKRVNPRRVKMITGD
jgi:hypothetical protein